MGGTAQACDAADRLKEGVVVVVVGEGRDHGRGSRNWETEKRHEDCEGWSVRESWTVLQNGTG